MNILGHEYTHHDQAVLAIRFILEEMGIGKDPLTQEINRVKKVYLDRALAEAGGGIGRQKHSSVANELIGAALHLNQLQPLTLAEKSRANLIFEANRIGSGFYQESFHSDYLKLSEGKSKLEKLTVLKFGELNWVLRKYAQDFGLKREANDLGLIWKHYDINRQQPEEAEKLISPYLSPLNRPALETEMKEMIDKVLPILRARDEIATERYMSYVEHESQFYGDKFARILDL